jgi:8-hydroxy-5-deazaflavin:NADPH oxidoreductase
VSNPLDFSRGMPPSLLISNTNSLGEEVQKALPGALVVKTLNIVSNEIMVDPGKTGGEPTMFVCGNDKGAKEKAVAILKQFGWSDIIDLGDITNARGTEMILPIWVRTWNALQDGTFAFKVLRKK